MYCEHLECRRLWSVTVIEGFPGFYEIYGDESDNEISVHISMETEEFTVDGRTYGGLQHLDIYGLGGNDTITAGASAPGLISVSIDGGHGDDEITLNLDGAVRGDAGSDHIYLYEAFRGEAYGGADDDYMWIGGNNVDANVHGGEGNDYINASTNNYRISIHGGDGDDTIFGTEFDDLLIGGLGSDIIFGLGGNDDVYSFDSAYDFAFGGEGDDSAWSDIAEGYMTDFEHVFYG